ncbi:putative disease resistance RPP13-like protein 3 [Pistacia vera]|uniref:putative disease resistance RPP13-like protein 3 n=1 Tax=Pistacia vera TaxID=55513 RepID=UPI001263756C|nr:putative disease resistance RPP13-like protein 3 [Pistacia vera]
MAAYITILHVREKLKKLVYGEAKFHPLLPQLYQFIYRRSDVEEFLQNDSSGILNPEFMEALYMVEDAIDKFRVTKSIQNEKYTPALKTNNLNEKPILKIVLDESKSFSQAEGPHQISNGYSDKKSKTSPSEDGMEELQELILSGEASPFQISVVEYDSKRKPLLKIYKDENVKKHFECRAWVRVPQEFDKRLLLRKIFKQVTEKSEGMEEHSDSLQQDLHDFLIEKRYLVVLTDVRTLDLWEIIKFALPSSSNGSRVIFSFPEADAERYPDIRFFGRELSLYARSKDVGAGIPSIDEHESQAPIKIEREISAEEVSVAIGEKVHAEEAPIAIEKKVPTEEAPVVIKIEVSETLKEALDYLNKETDIIGIRKDKILELAKLTLLPSDKNLHIAVVGEVGSGKTAVVRTVYENTYIQQNFNCRAWISISHDYDERDILIEMWQQVTKDSDAKKLSSNENLEAELTNFLSQKKFLLVLDNLNLPAAWYDLQKICSPGLSNGSRVIITTSDAFIARIFSPSINILELKTLNADDSWKLILKKLRGDKSLEDKESDLKEKFWKCCRGQPLAIHVLGGLLSGTKKDMDYYKWFTEIEKKMKGEIIKERSVEDTEKQEEASDEEEYTEQRTTWEKQDNKNIWTLSYKYLPPRLKALVNYLYLFPKSDEIPVRRLFHLWIAEGLGTPREGTEMTPEGLGTPGEVTEMTPEGLGIPGEVTEMAPEDQVKSDFDELVQRNLIEVTKRRLDDSPKTCRLPKTLYSTFIEKAEQMEFFYLHKGKNSSSISCIRRLAEHWDIQDGTPLDDWFKNLHSYISCNTQKGGKTSESVGNFLNNVIIKQGFQVLRVLDLEGVYKPVLPKLLGKLLLLRHIGLRKTFVDSIPTSVGDLPCLQIIDVKNTNITTLPKGILEAKHLRHLYLNEISFPLSTLKSLKHGSLSKLLTLWGLFIRETECPKREWWNELKCLRKVGLTAHTKSLKIITEWILERTTLRSLRLRTINDNDEPSDLDLGSLKSHEELKEMYLVGKLQKSIQPPPNLRILTLSLTRLNEDSIATLGQLKQLKVLRLFADSYQGKQMTCKRDDFPELCVLKLWKLKELRDWQINEQAMPLLKSLELRDCHKLKKIVALKNVTSLKELTLTNMTENFVIEALKNVTFLKELTLTNVKEDCVVQIEESFGKKGTITRPTGKQNNNIVKIRWD